MTKCELIKMLQEHDSLDDTPIMFFDGSYDSEPQEANALCLEPDGLYLVYNKTDKDIEEDKRREEAIKEEGMEMAIYLNSLSKEEREQKIAEFNSGFLGHIPNNFNSWFNNKERI